jgi:mRNA-degrading endonuclease YafQ of YafQ-DinJ toxin-antitoxin module
MRIIRQTTQFKKDAKRMGKRGKNFLEFKGIISKLASGIQLEF